MVCRLEDQYPSCFFVLFQPPVPHSNTPPPASTPPSTSTLPTSKEIMKVLLELKGTVEKVADHLLRDNYSEVKENDVYIVSCNQVICGFIFTL